MNTLGHHGRVINLVASVVLAGTSAGCDRPSERSEALVVAEQDSAGVRIVRLGDIYTASLPEWRVVEQLVIGQGDGVPEQELYRVSGAIVLHDGSIAVANRGSAEVRVFDRDGRHLRSFGREGEGPGEFKRLSWLARTGGDTLVAFDTDLRRATWFTVGGELVRTLTIDPETADPANATPFGTGSVEAVGAERGRVVVRAGYARRSGEGEYRDTFTLYVVDEAGALVDSLGSYAGRELFFQGSLPGPILASPPVFGRDTRVAASAGRVVAGSTERFELHVYEDGALHTMIVADVALTRVRETEIESWLNRHRARAAEASGPAGDVMRLLIENAPVRDTPPAFQRLKVDTERSMWVEEPYRVPDGSSRWIVLSEGGIPMAGVEFPLRGPDLEILDIGERYVLALRRDEFEVETLVLYELERDD